ncbi:CinA-like protein [Bacteroidota bacterium]|nr:CinA-like protein [Bacteroidota bacterium]
MNCCIVTIGDELLIGQVVDTNSAFIGQEMSKLGVRIHSRISVGDREEDILRALDQAKQVADIILITGGLGPTKDDITKNVLCKYFGAKLIVNEEVLYNVKGFFTRLNRPMLETNLKQAEVPDNCVVIKNKNGTAPGMWFQQEKKVFVSMPGVPYEMKTMLTEEIIPRLKKTFSFPIIIHRTIMTCGIGESFLAELIKDWEENLPTHFRFAYLPALNQLRLRITATGTDESKLKEEIGDQESKLIPLIDKYVFGYDDEPLESVVGKMLKERNANIALAESCTGGYIAHKLTSISGSSSYFDGSLITYSYDAKENFLGVNHETLLHSGAVSEETVREMVAGVKQKFKTTYAIAVSGIAGPDGGTPDKPVGTVWIALATEKEIIAKKFFFHRNRIQNIEMTCVAALNMLRMELLNTLEQ